MKLALHLENQHSVFFGGHSDILMLENLCHARKSVSGIDADEHILNAAFVDIYKRLRCRALATGQVSHV